MTLSKRIKLFLLIIFCIPTPFTYGQNNQEVIYLEADNVNYDYKKGIIRYEGNVHAKQGSTALTADKMIVYYNQKHKIEKVVATGKLAHYKTLLKEDKDSLKAEARSIFYYPIAGKVILEQEAKVEYNKNLFLGPSIFYDMNNKVISSRPNQNSQSTIVLEPIKQLKLSK